MTGTVNQFPGFDFKLRYCCDRQRPVRVEPVMSKQATSSEGGWLFKEEPSCYSFSQLVEDGETWWSGVENNLARKHLRMVKKGDRVLFYQTGKIKAIVGEMIVADGPRQDPDSEDPASVVVKVKPGKAWPNLVTLASIKQTKELASWDLVRNSRLSVMPVTPEQWLTLEKMSKNEA